MKGEPIEKGALCMIVRAVPSQEFRLGSVVVATGRWMKVRAGDMARFDDGQIAPVPDWVDGFCLQMFRHGDDEFSWPSHWVIRIDGDPQLREEESDALVDQTAE
jgi:hypothetical protein